MPASIWLAGGIKSRNILVLMLLVAAALVSPQLPAMESLQGEKLQLRIGALAEDPRVAGQEVADAWFLARFYERRRFTPAWDSPVKLAGLLAAVNDSTHHGLAPGDYHLDTLAELVAALRQAPNAGAAVELDLLATDALVRLAFHLRFGKVNPRQLQPIWTVPPTILQKDLLPDIRRAPEVLQRRNMVVLDAQGRHVDPPGGYEEALR